MAAIRRFGLFSQLRSEASRHVIHFRKGCIKRSGRGLVFRFEPETASIAELPVDDREMTLFVRGCSKDFQTLSVQGTDRLARGRTPDAGRPRRLLDRPFHRQAAGRAR